MVQFFNRGGGTGSAIWTKDDSTNNLNGLYAVKKITLPEKLDGVDLAQSLTISGRLQHILDSAAEIVIPARYTTVNWQYANTYYPQFESLEILGATTINFGNINHLRRLKKMSWKEFAGTLGSDWLSSSDLDAVPISDELFLDFPKATTFQSNIGRDSHRVSLSLRVDSVTDIGATGANANCLRYCSGDWTFPSCKRIGYWPRPDEEQTLRLPLIETMYEPWTTGSDSPAVTHLYLGPNLASIMSSAISAINARPTAFDIVIPAGASTTKTTLDAARIAYRQEV